LKALVATLVVIAACAFPLFSGAEPSAASTPFGSVVSVASGGNSTCELNTSGGVDCWGDGSDGQLGNGIFYTTGNDGSATPVQVLGVGGTGTLTGVASLTSETNRYGYCALLTSGGVDCWGYGFDGELGDGNYYTTGNDGSATPVQVVGLGGTGTLTGVASLASNGEGFCALLTSSGVDCWGYGPYGQLGNGNFYTTGNDGSATPVQVLGLAGTGMLTGVASLTGSTDGNGYCALLTSGGVDCWGYGLEGQLGNGNFYTTGNEGSATPVQVVGVSGTGTLTGVASLASGNADFCALLAFGGVDCWGYGPYGELGNGIFYTTGNDGNATPVQVLGLGGTGTLSGVLSLASDANSYCALLTSGSVDCWGYGYFGDLGNGIFYTGGSFTSDGSATPVQVLGLGGTGTLTGVASLANDRIGYCAVLTSGSVDCWGDGLYGELGDGNFYTTGNDGSATPVQVLGLAGTGTLTGVASLTSGRTGYCALLKSGGVDCWGYGLEGQLGNGNFYTTGNEGSATPVQVIFPVFTTITSSTTDAFTQGVADNFTITTTGSPTPSVSESGALPPGVTFSDKGNGTASLSGDATASGTFPITITASNGLSPNTTQSFTLTVNPPVTTWNEISASSAPGGLDAASMAYDPATGQLLLFGGSPALNTYVNTTWVWNGSTWSQLSAATNPPVRANADFAYDTASGQMILFGGVGPGSTPLNDTWTWNGSTWSELSPGNSPPARYNASMAYDPATSQLVLFGGVGNSTATGGDTWTWNGSTWSEISPATSPSARSRAMFAYDPATSQLVLFGGGAPGTLAPLGDTWLWNGTTWSALTPATSPSVRNYSALVFDQSSEQLVLFGGSTSGSKTLGDTWDWTGTTWTQLSPATSPSARYRAAAAYDPASSQLLLYGGGNLSAYGTDTWSYEPVQATVPSAPSIGSAAAGNASATVTFNPPADNNGAVVNFYVVTATDLTNSANGGETARGAGSPLTVTGLTAGDSYTFAVTATNGAGTGPASGASNAVTPAAVPAAPTIGTATAGNASASVSFTPGANNGSPITNYTVTATDLTTPANGGQTAIGSGSPITVNGLTNGDSYTFAITATNGVGTGPASAPSNTVVPATAPAAPTIGTATAGNASASIFFSGPSNDGGATVSSYTVTATDLTTPANGGQTATGASSPITVSGLTNGDSYIFVATATNSVGTGPASGASNAITPFAPVAISSVTPGQLAQGTKTDVLINGSGFVSPLNVSISGGGVTLTLVSVSPSAATISAKVVAAAATGPRNVTVTDANGSATCSGCLIVTAAPTLISASPDHVAVGTSGSVTLIGSGFESGATVKFKGPSTKVSTVKSSIVVTSTTLTATITVPVGTPLGVYTVTITNPDHSSASCTTCFTVIAAPTLTTMSPGSVAKGTSSSVSLSGTGFATGARLSGPKGVSFSKVTVVNSTTITAIMKVASTTSTGTGLDVSVTNDATAGYGKVTAGVLTIT
jgi:alpha-tubulin suppressor-like RCC1 family protein